MKTTHVQSTSDSVLPDESQVVDFLHQNTDFFRRHPILLAEMEIPHQSGSAVSLVERQIRVLREKNQHYETRLRDLIEAARDNQRLTQSLQRLAIHLFQADSLDDIIASVHGELRNYLGTDFVSLHLLGTAEQAAQQPERYLLQNDKSLEMFNKVIRDKRIQCGRMNEEQINILFADHASEVGSGAVIPLCDTDTFGLLAVGGNDPQRYHPGMGTDYLKLLGELVSAAIKAHV